MSEVENNSEQPGFKFELPADVPEQPEQSVQLEPKQPEKTEQADTSEKTPFAKDEAILSGMVSSVLKPQNDKEREKIERQIKKRQEKLQGSGKRFSFTKFIGQILLVLILAGAGWFVYENPDIVKKLKRVNNKITQKITPSLNVWDIKPVVFKNTFRLKAKSSLGADRATLIIRDDGDKTQQIAGLIALEDEKSLTWEFFSGNLEKNKYTYKLFVRNSDSGELKELRGSFEIK